MLFIYAHVRPRTGALLNTTGIGVFSILDVHRYMYRYPLLYFWNATKVPRHGQI